MRSKLLLLAVIGVGGCLETTAPNTSLQTIAAVTGQVARVDGTGVGGPLISVQLLSAATTGGTARLISQGTVIGDEQGRFLFLFLINGEEAQTGSIILNVTPPIGSGLVAADTTGIPVKLVLGRTPTDTTYVQMTLQPRP